MGITKTRCPWADGDEKMTVYHEDTLRLLEKHFRLY